MRENLNVDSCVLGVVVGKKEEEGKGRGNLVRES